MARRARQLTVPGTSIGGLTAAPDGHSVALTVATAGGGGRGAGAANPANGIYIINVETGQLTRVPPAAQSAEAGGGGRGGGRGGFGGGGGMVFAPDGRTLYFRSGRSLFAAPISAERRRRQRRSGRRAGAAAAARPRRPRRRPRTPRLVR